MAKILWEAPCSEYLKGSFARGLCAHDFQEMFPGNRRVAFDDCVDEHRADHVSTVVDWHLANAGLKALTRGVRTAGSRDGLVEARHQLGVLDHVRQRTWGE